MDPREAKGAKPETQQQLQQHFRDSYIGSQHQLQEMFISQLVLADGDLSQLRDFFKRHDVGLRSREHGEHVLVQLKYAASCRFTEPWQHASRGTTFLLRDGKVVMSTFCFNKFFNFHEMNKYLGTRDTQYVEDVKATGAAIVLTNKEDGSNIKTWYDAQGNAYSCTLGSVDPTNLMQAEGSPSFWGLSLELLEQQYPKLLEYLKAHPGVSLVSELKSPWNQIVTLYDHEARRGTITPLVVIDREGVPQWRAIQALYPELFNEQGHPAHSMVLTSYPEDVEGYFGYLEANPQAVGTHPEGCVAYAVFPDGSVFPFAKGKRKAYLELHRAVDLIFHPPDPSQALYAVQTLVVADQFDDAADTAGRKDCEDHAEEFRRALRSMASRLDHALETLVAAKDKPKDFANLVEALPHSIRWIKPALFKARGGLSADFETYDFLVSTLKAGWKPNVPKPVLSQLHDTHGLRWWLKLESLDETSARASVEVAAPTAAA